MTGGDMNVLITGANRGLGLEFVKQLATSGTQIFAACRAPSQAKQLKQVQEQYPESVSIINLDVTDSTSISQSHRLIRTKTKNLDLLINNAGISVEDKGLGTFDVSSMKSILNVNTIAPLLIIQQYIDLLKKGNQPKIVNISSGLGSLARANSCRMSSCSTKYRTNEYTPTAIYSLSKAALNMGTIHLAHELKYDGIVVIALTPGWVKTDMGGENADITPQESIAGMVRVIDSLSLSDSGSYYDHTGQIVPW